MIIFTFFSGYMILWSAKIWGTSVFLKYSLIFQNLTSFCFLFCGKIDKLRNIVRIDSIALGTNFSHSLNFYKEKMLCVLISWYLVCLQFSLRISNRHFSLLTFKLIYSLNNNFHCLWFLKWIIILMQMEKVQNPHIFQSWDNIA